MITSEDVSELQFGRHPPGSEATPADNAAADRHFTIRSLQRC